RNPCCMQTRCLVLPPGVRVRLKLVVLVPADSTQPQCGHGLPPESRARHSETGSRSVSLGEPLDPPAGGSARRVNGERRESPLPAFFYFPLALRVLRRAAFPLSPLWFAGAQSGCGRDPQGSDRTPKISGQNSQTLRLLPPDGLTGWALSNPDAVVRTRPRRPAVLVPRFPNR